jgi:hypothetical protein
MIQDEWILRTMEFPDYEAIPTDGRIRRWKRIDEMGCLHFFEKLNPQALEQVVVFSLLILRCATGAHLNPRDPPTENLPSQ